MVEMTQCDPQPDRLQSINLQLLRMLRKQGVNKFTRIKITEIVELFADTDETNRDFTFPADISDDAALGSAVKLG